MPPTFTTLAPLGAYLMTQQHRRETWTSFCLMAQHTDAQLHAALDQMLPMVQRSSRRVWRQRSGHRVTMTLRYRDGVRLADAWQQGKLDTLTEQERAVLDQARAITRLHPALEDMATYLARHVRYENPLRGFRRYGEIVSCASALMEGTANCQGVSDAMYLLGTLAGYRMGYQQGRNQHGAHLWNTVALDTGCFMLDVTRTVTHPGEKVRLLDENACRDMGLRWEKWSESARPAWNESSE